MNPSSTSESATRELVAQERLLPFLLNPDSYPHRPRRVRLVQTHSSFVFIVRPFVYKVKKPVNFGFLNFSTLEKRRHFCEREVALNRRLSPKMYLGVVPIWTRNGQFTFDEGDEVVEYAVKMRKLADGRFLDQMVERDQVVPGDLNRIAIVLKQFYEAQHPTEEIEAWGPYRPPAHQHRRKFPPDSTICWRPPHPPFGHPLPQWRRGHGEGAALSTARHDLPPSL